LFEELCFIHKIKQNIEFSDYYKIFNKYSDILMPIYDSMFKYKELMTIIKKDDFTIQDIQ
jgi:hypothetical protein